MWQYANYLERVSIKVMIVMAELPKDIQNEGVYGVLPLGVVSRLSLLFGST